MGETLEPADELIARARRAYAECSSYADEGTQSQRFEPGSGALMPEHTRELRFRTRWRRPSQFLFEYVRPPNFKTWDAPAETWERYVVWHSPAGPRSWWTISTEEERESLDQAISAATGVSGGTAFKIPSLLGVISTPPHWFPSPIGFQGDVATHEGRECLRIPMMSGDLRQRLWLERSSGLVLRLDERQEFSVEGQVAMAIRNVERMRAEVAADPKKAERYGSLLETLEQDAERATKKAPNPFTTHTTTIYHPRMDPELRDEDFVFVPPAPA